jgi:hypothetical protein
MYEKNEKFLEYFLNTVLTENRDKEGLRDGHGISKGANDVELQLPVGPELLQHGGQVLTAQPVNVAHQHGTSCCKQEKNN